ncbi:cytochrome C3-like [Bradyrhizobium oligotrophicum S58]|uniref:Uptake hydrogenase large subunit n=1 Tax=Bradyrhizobium oligotrophicum S58 TaxID=1245469 RepID=M4Z9H8_9BRAD|nr:nickel-dependent hydrogenase large subunit [Bradyrhizobium oligotrophicum]BAM90364.1 cytochrome C3-like [Bradyrhizobium oligotrophicum S58]
MTSLTLPIPCETDDILAERASPVGPEAIACLAGRVGPGKALMAKIAQTNATLESDNSDPYRRIGGGLVLHCSIDLAERKVSDVASVATAYRGYESLLRNRGLQDAGLIGSTASGICGGVHAATSAQCLEMALGIRPPPLAIIARNLLLSCQYLNDNPMHLFVLCGPDYSEDVVKSANPEIWAVAQRTSTAHAAVHGYQTIGAIMTDLNRGCGKLFVEALDMMRTARAAYVLLGGRYPHSESICPGGVSLTLGTDQLDAFVQKLEPFVDYAKRCARIWDDVFDFLYSCNPAFRELGRGPASMIDFGQWDHEDYYDGTYANCDRWGEKRWSTPGAVIDGKLVTTDLRRLNSGIEEFVDRSFYDAWEGYPHRQDPAGNPVSQHHPWNKAINRNPAKNSNAPPYSWATAIVWDRNTFEVGAYARLYISALARKMPANEFAASTGRSVVLDVPAGELPSERLEWQVPPLWNAFERNRARAYAVAFNLMVTLENHRRARALLLRGERETLTPFDLPATGKRFGVGFGGAGRGFLAHWAVLTGAEISNYQVSVPSRINGGPRRPWGELGPCERAVLNTPIIESNWSGPASFHGIDLVRAIQSFDPCMPCQMHLIFKGTDLTSAIEVNTDQLI